MPRQQDLPGMSDRKLKDLHEAALDYAEKRDARMALSQEEVDLKKKVLALMKKHRVDHYEYDGVVCDRVLEEETVKVRVKAAEAEDEEEAEAS